LANKKKRHPGDKYRIPLHIEQGNRRAAEWAVWRRRPGLPQIRQILGCFAGFLLCTGMSLFLWLPARSVVQDLRDHGVTVVATVTGVDNRPKYVKVRFNQGPVKGTEVKLGDYAGMYPTTHVGKPMLVTYDPADPFRSLARHWVENPPPILPAYGTSALALFLLAGAIVGLIRRRRILRTFGPDIPP
jgi:uncharacterized protein DUF3592